MPELVCTKLWDQESGEVSAHCSHQLSSLPQHGGHFLTERAALGESSP